MVFDYMDHDMAGLLDRANRDKNAAAMEMSKLKRRQEYPEPPFAIGQVKRYMKQLFQGLALLQAKNILHRDLKNANLLVCNSGDLKIADFGLARSMLAPQSRSNDETDGVKSEPAAAAGSEKEKGKRVLMTNRVITLWYRPPELCLGADIYGKEVDMWSAGCIMVEMLTGRPLFPGKDETTQVEIICKVLGRPTENTLPNCTNLKK